jgi:UDP-glucose:(heptosyl)LPS alpha-1,3-glucosyltransferase
MSTPMHRIAVVIPKYGLTGGAEGFTAELTERIAGRQNYEVHVFANRWADSSGRVTFHRVPVISFPKFLTTISFAWFAGRMIARMNFDLVHAHDRLLEADIFTMHGIPHRTWVREIRNKTLSLFDYVTDRVEQRLVQSKRCRYFLAVSGLAREKFLEAYRTDPLAVKVVSPGVDAARFQQLDRQLCRREVRNALGIGAGEVIILFASMNFEIKGLERLIMALAALKHTCPAEKFKLLVVGKGNIRKYTKLALRSGMGDHIVFTGTLGDAEIAKTYMASDIFSILSRFDTFGMVVLEAMAASLPVVISSNVGARDVVREGRNGFVIDDRDNAGQIAAKIGLLLDHQVREKMGAEALRTARENTWEAAVDKVVAVYESALQNLAGAKMPQPQERYNHS